MPTRFLIVKHARKLSALRVFRIQGSIINQVLQLVFQLAQIPISKQNYLPQHVQSVLVLFSIARFAIKRSV